MSKELNVNPMPRPRMTWYAYCADGTSGSETFSVPIRANPTVCSIAATRKM